MSNLVGLGGSLNQEDSKKGNSENCPCGISGGGGVSERKGNSTGLPSGTRQGFGDEKGERTYIFRRKKWNEE